MQTSRRRSRADGDAVRPRRRKYAASFFNSLDVHTLIYLHHGSSYHRESSPAAERGGDGGRVDSFDARKLVPLVVFRSERRDRAAVTAAVGTAARAEGEAFRPAARLAVARRRRPDPRASSASLRRRTRDILEGEPRHAPLLQLAAPRGDGGAARRDAKNGSAAAAAAARGERGASDTAPVASDRGSAGARQPDCLDASCEAAVHPCAAAAPREQVRRRRRRRRHARRVDGAPMVTPRAARGVQRRRRRRRRHGGAGGGGTPRGGGTVAAATAEAEAGR